MLLKNELLTAQVWHMDCYLSMEGQDSQFNIPRPLRPSLPVTRGPPVRGHAGERKKKKNPLLEEN